MELAKPLHEHLNTKKAPPRPQIQKGPNQVPDIGSRTLGSYPFFFLKQ